MPRTAKTMIRISVENHFRTLRFLAISTPTGRATMTPKVVATIEIATDSMSPEISIDRSPAKDGGTICFNTI